MVDTAADEEALRGGNISAGVVRVRQTVRRPTGPWTPAVHSLLRHLELAGFQGAPRVYGLDELGREVLEFVEGEVPWPHRHRGLLGGLDSMHRVGALLRSFHDAVASFSVDPKAVWRFPEMAADSESFIDDRGIIICHNDPAAWNIVIGRDRWALVDWDAAGPRLPIWDVAYCAVGVVPGHLRCDFGGLGTTAPISPSVTSAGRRLRPDCLRASASARGHRCPCSQQLPAPPPARRSRNGAVGRTMAQRSRRCLVVHAAFR